MKVLKFGGTSVANAQQIKQVLKIVSDTKADRIVVVVSALQGVTDLLLSAAQKASIHDYTYLKDLQHIEDIHLKTIRELLPVGTQSAVLSKVKSQLNVLEGLLEGANLVGEVTPKLSDKIVGYGELLSSYIIGEYFVSEKLESSFKDARELIITDNNYGRASVDFSKTDDLCRAYFRTAKQAIVVLPGFIAATIDGHPTTLGRGGSDYSAAIIAGVMNAQELQIWTDVSGIYTANPKLVKQAKSIPNISYEEAMELSHFGAKVLYPPTIQPVYTKLIPIAIKNTNEPKAEGTLIGIQNLEKNRSVSGISNIDNIALLSLEGPGMIGIPGFSKRLFEALSQAHINVILITQASSEHSICVGISEYEVVLAASKVNETFDYEIATGKIKPAIVEQNLAIVALVGDHMRSHQGLSGKMFSALGKNNVNIRAIAQGASERNISAVIKMEDVKKALNTLHEEFFEEHTKQLNLFVLGVGNVGARFLDQIKQQKSYLKDHLLLNVRVIAISNSRTMMFDDGGIQLINWKDNLGKGEKADSNLFFSRVLKLNYRNSILVDNTASEQIAASYLQYLKQSIAIVTCNKIASSSTYEIYHNLKQTSKEFYAPFLFETNVGAGLPIIDTLKNLIASGDTVVKIQAVLSGSLNFIFNNFNDTVTFHSIVKKAQEEGYTEPDPKIDLSGIDVMRKILILARESGYKMNLEDIENSSFLPEESLKAEDINQFFDSLKKYEDTFQKLYEEANKSGCKLKYVAQLEKGKASVGLQQVPKEHDFYNLKGNDNIILFYTKRYTEQPLIIKGAGAGAEVTASGLFADIIRIGNF